MYTATTEFTIKETARGTQMQGSSRSRYVASWRLGLLQARRLELNYSSLSIRNSECRRSATGQQKWCSRHGHRSDAIRELFRTATMNTPLVRIARFRPKWIINCGLPVIRPGSMPSADHHFLQADLSLLIAITSMRRVLDRVVMTVLGFIRDGLLTRSA
jgi:hypothetical protein